MTPWIVDRYRHYSRICRLSFHVAKSYFNPFGPHFLHPLAFELWYLITHEQEASAQMEETVVGGPAAEFSFADDMMLSDSPDLVEDEELEACLTAARGEQERFRGITKRTPPKVSFVSLFFQFLTGWSPEKLDRRSPKLGCPSRYPLHVVL